MMEKKFALAQFSMSAVYEENIQKADRMIEKAAEEGASLLLLPELFEGLYFCQIEDYEKFALAENAKDSKTLKHFQETAKKFNMVLPISFFEKSGPAYFNSLAMIDADGSVLGIYRKSHIPTGECYEEKFYFSPGNTGFKVFDTKAGKIGCAVCWDQWFPEAARIMALKGAQILLYPSAIGSEPILPKDSKNHWQNTMRGHAAANIMPLLGCNRVGVESAGKSSMKFFGSSFIADQHGEKIAELNREEEGILAASFDLEAIDKERVDWGVFRDRRVDLYGDILKFSGEDD
ncbi:MAG: N-carbamoylputrescine amidase [Bacilli bacterium]|nr:N-carbamoylputrescine amidase [Bacilli bacterium]